MGGQAPIPPAKCIISRDQWAGPGKDNALTGRVKTVGEFQNKSSSRVKKGKGGHGNVSAGRWPETEVNRRVGQFQCSSNCHRSHILTSDTVRTPTQPLPPYNNTPSVAKAAISLQRPHNASGLVCEFWFVSMLCLQTDSERQRNSHLISDMQRRQYSTVSTVHPC